MEEVVARRKEQPQTGHRSTRPSLRLHSVEATTQQLMRKFTTTNSTPPKPSRVARCCRFPASCVEHNHSEAC